MRKQRLRRCQYSLSNYCMKDYFSYKIKSDKIAGGYQKFSKIVPKSVTS